MPRPAPNKITRHHFDGGVDPPKSAAANSDPTPAMIEAGKKALERSGILENDLFRVHIDDVVIRSIFQAMLAARQESPQTT